MKNDYVIESKVEDYTEKDFLALLQMICSNAGTEAEQNLWLENFIEVTNHPDGSDLIYYPEDGADDTPEGILKTVKEWRESQGLPLFKDSK